MRIEVTKTSPQEVKFTMRGVTTQLANALRRAVLSHIPTAAMLGFPDAESTINITANSGPFNNEILKQRIQCIPVHITDRSVDLDQYTVVVDVAAIDSVRNVTTEDIKILFGDSKTELPVKTVRTIFPPDPITGDYILITRLNPGIRGVAPPERLTLTAKLYWTDGSVSGTASAASTCSYAATPDLEQQEVQWQKMADTITSNTEQARIDFLLGPGSRIVTPGSFDWVLETVGVYKPLELLDIACDVVTSDIAANVAALSEPGRITPLTDGMKNSYSVRITGDEYAVGYLLQTALYDTHCLSEPSNYVGFRKEHPHDGYGTLKLALQDISSVEAIATIVTRAATAVTEAIAVVKENTRVAMSATD